MLEVGGRAAEIDLELTAAAVERAFPDLAPVRPLTLLGSGFRSTAFETPAGVVLRVGRSMDAADDYAREWRIGPFLAQHLGSVVPRPRWYAPPCDGLPYGALGYAKLPGETPAWGHDPGAQFARDLGAFMAKLHALPLAEARAAGVPAVDAWARMLGARDVVTPVLHARLAPADAAVVDAWWAEFASDDRMRAPRLAVCHHDLWHDNLLHSPAGALSGVLDIAHAEISDPAHDFAAPRHFGEGFMAELVAAYRTAGGEHDAEDAHRARRFWQARELGGLAWAVEHHDAPEIDDALEKIRRGPILRVERIGSDQPRDPTSNI